MDPKYACQAARLNRGPLGRLCLELLGRLHVEMCGRRGPATLHLAAIARSLLRSSHASSVTFSAQGGRGAIQKKGMQLTIREGLYESNREPAASVMSAKPPRGRKPAPFLSPRTRGHARARAR